MKYRKVIIVGDEVTDVPSVGDAIVVGVNDLWKTYRGWTYLVYTPNYKNKDELLAKTFVSTKKVIESEQKDGLLAALHWSLKAFSPAQIAVLGFANNEYSPEVMKELMSLKEQELGKIYNLNTYENAEDTRLLLQMIDLKKFLKLKG